MFFTGWRGEKVIANEMSSSSGKGRGRGRGRGRSRGPSAQNNNYIEQTRPGRVQHVEPLKPVENQIPEVKPPSSVEERPTVQHKPASSTNGIPNEAEKTSRLTIANAKCFFLSLA